MAEENLSWGYSRIRDALHNLGITTDRNTVKRILNDHGIEPAPKRKRKMPWSTFIAAHLDVLAAMDFFNIEVLTFAGIVRYHVFFAIHLKTREVQIVGIKASPSEEWMKQMPRNLTDCFDGFLKDMRYVIMDRDPLYTPSIQSSDSCPAEFWHRMRSPASLLPDLLLMRSIQYPGLFHELRLKFRDSGGQIHGAVLYGQYEDAVLERRANQKMLPDTIETQVLGDFGFRPQQLGVQPNKIERVLNALDILRGNVLGPSFEGIVLDILNVE